MIHCPTNNSRKKRERGKIQKKKKKGNQERYENSTFPMIFISSSLIFFHYKYQKSRYLLLYSFKIIFNTALNTSMGLGSKSTWAYIDYDAPVSNIECLVFPTS